MIETMAIDRKPVLHPKKFIVYLLMASSVMLFAGLSSAYIVSKGSGSWLEFELPDAFATSTVLVVVGSVLIHLGYLSLKKDNIGMVRLYLITAFLIGIGFLASQVYSFYQIYNYDFPIVFGGSQSNPSGSYLYALAFVHGLHLIIGLGFVLFLLSSTFKGKVNSSNMARYEGCQTFWHFLGGLWVYLYVFLIIYH